MGKLFTQGWFDRVESLIALAMARASAALPASQQVIVPLTKFGAKGNGIQDDSPFIATGFASLAGTGLTAYFTGGNYKLLHPVTWPSDLRILATAAVTFTTAIADGGGLSNSTFRTPFQVNGPTSTTLAADFTPNDLTPAEIQVTSSAGFAIGDQVALFVGAYPFFGTVTGVPDGTHLVFERPIPFPLDHTAPNAVENGAVWVHDVWADFGGATIRGTNQADCHLWLVGARDCHVKGLDFDLTVTGAGAVLTACKVDEGSLRTTVEDSRAFGQSTATVESAWTIEGGEDSHLIRCYASGFLNNGIGYILADSSNCSTQSCVAETCGVGALVGAEFVGGGCLDCTVGGEFSYCPTGVVTADPTGAPKQTRTTVNAIASYCTAAGILEASTNTTIIGRTTGNLVGLSVTATAKNPTITGSYRGNVTGILGAAGATGVSIHDVDVGGCSTAAMTLHCDTTQSNVQALGPNPVAPGGTSFEFFAGKHFVSGFNYECTSVNVAVIQTQGSSRLVLRRAHFIATAVNYQATNCFNTSVIDIDETICDHGLTGASQSGSVNVGATMRVGPNFQDHTGTGIGTAGPGSFLNRADQNGGNSIVANGAGTAQATAWPDITPTDRVIFRLLAAGGVPTPYSVPYTITPGTGFAPTFAAGDTSTYEYIIT